MIQKWTVKKSTTVGAPWCVYSPEGFYLCRLPRWEQAMNLASIRARVSADKGLVTLKLPKRADCRCAYQVSGIDNPTVTLHLGNYRISMFAEDIPRILGTLFYHHLKGGTKWER